MTPEAGLFFGENTGALTIYAALEEAILARYGRVRVKVGKSQISFANRHGFAYASLPRGGMKKQAELIVTFGLPYRLESPRILAAVEPYPMRWTHHVGVRRAAELDGELLGWIGLSYDFSMAK